MAAVTQDDTATTGFQIPPGMKGPLIFSGIFHVSIVVLMLVGLPYVSSPPKEMQTAVPVEILPIAEMTTTNKPPVQARPKPPEEQLEKPVQKEKPPAPPKMDAVEPPKDTPKPVKEAVKPKPKPVAPPPAEKLKEPEPKPEEKPKEEIAEAQQQDFASLLKNLQESDPVVDEALPESPDAVAPAASPLAAFSEKLTMSEADALSQQLSRCWSIQAGARYAEDLVVKVRLTVSPERRVMSAMIEDQWRYGQDSYFRAAADSAIRAVNSPQCETLQLPPEKYDLWKDIVVTFDPRDML
jgi:outer membrane biosynthesis protein TonB